MNEQQTAVINAAIKFKQGCDILANRVDMMQKGYDFSVDELDELDLEKVLAELDLITAVNNLST